VKVLSEEEVIKINGDVITINPDAMVEGKLYKFKFKNNEYGVYKTKTKIVLLEKEQ